MKNEDSETVRSQLLSLLLSPPATEEEVNKVKQNSEKIVKMYKKTQ